MKLVSLERSFESPTPTLRKLAKLSLEAADSEKTGNTNGKQNGNTLKTAAKSKATLPPGISPMLPDRLPASDSPQFQRMASMETLVLGEDIPETEMDSQTPEPFLFRNLDFSAQGEGEELEVKTKEANTEIKETPIPAEPTPEVEIKNAIPAEPTPPVEIKETPPAEPTPPVEIKETPSPTEPTPPVEKKETPSPAESTGVKKQEPEKKQRAKPGSKAKAKAKNKRGLKQTAEQKKKVHRLASDRWHAKWLRKGVPRQQDGAEPESKKDDGKKITTEPTKKRRTSERKGTKGTAERKGTKPIVERKGTKGSSASPKKRDLRTVKAEFVKTFLETYVNEEPETKKQRLGKAIAAWMGSELRAKLMTKPGKQALS